MTIWGNHSDTQYPDYKNARIDGKPATEVISDAAWFTETYIPTVAKRGGAVIKARGASSAASAANAVIDSLRSLNAPTPKGDWFSAAVVSDGSYGIPAGLIYSYPLTSPGDGTWSIVAGVPIDDEARRRLDASAAELVAERDAVKELLGPGVTRAIGEPSSLVGAALGDRTVIERCRRMPDHEVGNVAWSGIMDRRLRSRGCARSGEAGHS